MKTGKASYTSDEVRAFLPNREVLNSIVTTSQVQRSQQPQGVGRASICQRLFRGQGLWENYQFYDTPYSLVVVGCETLYEKSGSASGNLL